MGLGRAMSGPEAAAIALVVVILIVRLLGRFVP